MRAGPVKPPALHSIYMMRVFIVVFHANRTLAHSGDLGFTTATQFCISRRALAPGSELPRTTFYRNAQKMPHWRFREAFIVAKLLAPPTIPKGCQPLAQGRVFAHPGNDIRANSF